MKENWGSGPPAFQKFDGLSSLEYQENTYRWIRLQETGEIAVFPETVESYWKGLKSSLEKR